MSPRRTLERENAQEVPEIEKKTNTTTPCAMRRASLSWNHAHQRQKAALSPAMPLPNHAEQHGKVVQDHEQYAKTAQKIYLPYALFGARRDESDFRVFGYEKGRVGHLLSFFHSVLTSASPFPRFS